MNDTIQQADFPVTPSYGDTVPRLATSSVLGESSQFRVHTPTLDSPVQRRVQLEPIVSTVLALDENSSSASLEAGFIDPQLRRLAAGRATVAGTALMLLNVGRFGEVVDIIRARGAHDFWSASCLAQALYRLGHHEEARHTLEAYATQSQGDARPWHVMGRLLIDDMKWQSAISILERATKLPDAPAAVFNDLGVAQLALGLLDQSIRSFRTALRIDSACALSLTNLGVCFQIKNDLARAKNFLRQALLSDPQCASAVHNLAECLIATDSLDEAVRLLEGRPQPEARERLAWAYLRRGDTRKAREILDAEARKSGAVDVLNNLGVVCGKQGDFIAAERAFEQALQRAPSPSVARCNYAAMQYRRELYHEVLRILPPEIAIADLESVRLLTNTLFRIERADLARTLLEDARARYGDDKGILMSLSAVYTSHLGRPDLAIQLLRGVPRLFEDIMLSNNLAYAYLVAGEPSNARAVMEPIRQRVLQVEDSTTAVCATATLGLLEIAEGRYDMGMELYRRAHSLATGTTKRRVAQKILVEEARQLYRVGRNALAAQKLEKALTGPDSEFRREAKALRESPEALN